MQQQIGIMKLGGGGRIKWLSAQKAKQLFQRFKGGPMSCVEGVDPRCLGYDGQQYDMGGVISQASDVLDYASGGSDTIQLPTDRLITAIMLVADPYRHGVTTAAITAVEDAADKLLSGLNISSSKGTYVQLSSTLLFMKAISAMNKLVYGNIMHEDLATAVAVDNDSRQAWYFHFGVLNDYDHFDISAGIPAQLVEALNINGTFGASQLIAAVAANGAIDPNTDVYAVVFGVQGLEQVPGYLENLPTPEFTHDHITSVTSNSEFEIVAGRWLKRSTIVNLAVAGSNNEARNDSNIIDLTLEFSKPTLTKLIDQMRWQLAKAAFQPGYRGGSLDRDGGMAVASAGLPGVLMIDWRTITKNPYGLPTTALSRGDAKIKLVMGTTDGSLHVFNEYYNVPNPKDAERWAAFRPQ